MGWFSARPMFNTTFCDPQSNASVMKGEMHQKVSSRDACLCGCSIRGIPHRSRGQVLKGRFHYIGMLVDVCNGSPVIHGEYDGCVGDRLDTADSVDLSGGPANGETHSPQGLGLDKLGYDFRRIWRKTRSGHAWPNNEDYFFEESNPRTRSGVCVIHVSNDSFEV